ncbi:MAG: hypothetical protein AB1758_00320 [Candidatus Eremiobacterota bacterium]
MNELWEEARRLPWEDLERLHATEEILDSFRIRREVALGPEQAVGVVSIHREGCPVLARTWVLRRAA